MGVDSLLRLPRITLLNINQNSIIASNIDMLGLYEKVPGLGRCRHNANGGHTTVAAFVRMTNNIISFTTNLSLSARFLLCII